MRCVVDRRRGWVYRYIGLSIGPGRRQLEGGDAECRYCCDYSQLHFLEPGFGWEWSVG